MKHILSLLSLLIIFSTAHAQAPQGIPYQAAARNSSGAVLASTNISVRFTIRDSIATGAIKYRETHSVTTSAQGMFSVNVGQGTVVTGTFSSINWGKNAKFMQVEMDPAGGSSYIDMGTQQMMSVPYALNAGALKLTVSATGDTLYSGGGKYVIIPGISAANCTLPSPGTITGAAGTCVGATTTLSSSVSGGVWSSSNASIATVNSTGVVTGVATGSATISYSITNSCGVAVATRDVTIIIGASIVGITGSGIVCSGATTTLSHESPGGTWSSANTSVATIGSTGILTGAASGTATISYIVTYPYGCGSAVATQVVTVNALPTAGTITGTATVTAGSTTTLSNATSGGTWSSSATGIATVGSTGVVTGVLAGTVTISYMVTNSCGSVVATRVVTVSVPSTIGATYGGGKIAYILQVGDPGYIAGETHGLIAAPSDQSTGIKWGCYPTLVGGISTALGTGAANTAIVSAACGAGTAARLCADLVLNSYSDWYLPSRDELQKVYINRIYIGGFTTGDYWSSSEGNGINAVSVNFYDAFYYLNVKNYTYYVRAVRSF